MNDTTSTLDQLKTMTTIVADTGDLQAIARLKPVDATTNPSLITAALTAPDKQALLKQTMAAHQGDIDAVIDALTIHTGVEILALIEGRVSTEVDARLSFETEATVKKAHEFIEAYQQRGVDPKRVLIKIAATWQGIKAAEQLEKAGIHCNLTLLFGGHQAKACADAGVTLISPFVGRILDWQKQHEGVDSIAIVDDLGVQSVKQIYNYYKQHHYTTQVMGASFRSTAQICALAGCDLLTISPSLLDQLAQQTGTLTRVLSPNMDFEPIAKRPITLVSYQADEAQDPITQALLPKGIDGFVDARKALAEKLASL